MPTRYLKPGICDSETIDRCSPMAECLFYRLLVNVDDFGRIDARPAVVRSKCFPLKDTITNKDVTELLSELHDVGLIHLYNSDGCAYLQMKKWDNAPRAHKSKFPSPPDDCMQSHTDVRNPSAVLPVTETVTKTETGNRNRKPETGTVVCGAEKSDGDEKHGKKNTARGSRLSPDWVLPKSWGEWAMQEKPGWTPEDVRKCAERFRDFWISKAGKDAAKLDWEATWRNWVRNENIRSTGKSVATGSNHAAVTNWLSREEGGNVIEGECHAAK